MRISLEEIRLANEELKFLLDQEAGLKKAIAQSIDPAERRQLEKLLHDVRVDRERRLIEEKQSAEKAGYISSTCGIDLPKDALVGMSTGALAAYKTIVSRVARDEFVKEATKWGVTRARAERAAKAARNAGRSPAARAVLLGIGFSAAVLAAYETEVEEAIRKQIESSEEMQQRLTRFCEN